MQKQVFKMLLLSAILLSISACTDRLETPDNRASSGISESAVIDQISASPADTKALTTSPPGQYTGSMKNGKYDGQGVLIKPNKDRFEGTFKAGLMEGTGLFVGANGDSYEGEFANNIYSGKGRWESNSGDVYTGMFKRGMLNGEGTIVRLNGSSYSGNVLNDRPEGKGTITLENGDVYVGEFKSGLFHGAGLMTFKEPRLGDKTEDKTGDKTKDANVDIGTKFIKGEWRFGRFVGEDKLPDEPQPLIVENFIYDQPKLLQSQIEGLKPRAPNEPNMYFLAVAGDGEMEVFRREVQFVEKQFAQNFSTQGRSIVLANTADYAADFPMANQISLQRALDAIAKQMDKQNDILFLFMTSHGSKEHEFSLRHPYAAIQDLPAKTLATMLERTGIRHKVIVISACYSGGFIDPLKNDHHLILTAARRDRSSFGCATENNFTYFGRAFFNDALPTATSFQEAFERAKGSVAQWEARDFAVAKKNKEYLEARRKRLNVPVPEVKPMAKIAASANAAVGAVTKALRSFGDDDTGDKNDNDDGENQPSLPQIYVGKKIAPVLENWWKASRKVSPAK